MKEMEEEMGSKKRVLKLCIEEFLKNRCKRVANIKEAATWVDFIEALAEYLNCSKARARTHAGEFGLKEQRTARNRIARDKDSAWALV